MKSHPLAGKTVTIKCAPDGDKLNGKPFRIEDYWHVLTGGSWMAAQGNFACLKYAIRSAVAKLPIDDKVLYGKVGPFGHLIHESELGPEV